ncbi:MAG TPA: signal peptidase I [Anaerolineae bacterium]
MLPPLPDVSTPPIEPAPQQPAAPNSRLSLFAREVVDTLLLTAIIFLLVNTATARFTIRSVSMLPNLHEGQYVIVDKVSYLLHSPERGDIVVLAIANQEDDLIKRIIGLPGETLSMENGVVLIDRQPIDEPYTLPPPGGSFAAQTLGPDDYFVMGDNRSNSKDSRNFGPVRRESIVGRAWIIYWPPSDWGIVPHQAYAEGN